MVTNTYAVAGRLGAGYTYNTIDVDDGAVEGGNMDLWTVGVDYYWRSNFKVMLDYVAVASERRGVSDAPNSSRRACSSSGKAVRRSTKKRGLGPRFFCERCADSRGV